jgi:hypothetical protein
MKIYCRNVYGLIQDVLNTAMEKGLGNGLRTTYTEPAEIKIGNRSFTIVIRVNESNEDLLYTMWVRVKHYVGLDTLAKINEFALSLREDLETDAYFGLKEQ